MRLRALVLVGVLAAMAVGQPCPEHCFKDITESPYNIDPNRIAVDPYTGERSCLGWGLVELGLTSIVEVAYCDPDGDPFTITCDDPTATVHREGDPWLIVMDVPYRQWKVVRITATDTPRDAEPATARYWMVVYGVLRPNRAPILL